MKSAAVKFRPSSSSAQTSRSSSRAARTFQGQSAALLEVLRGQPPAHRAARITRAAAIFATTRRLARRLSHREGVAVKLDFIPFGPINAAARPHSRAETSAILLGRWRHSAGAHRGLALVRSAQRQKLRCAARRFEMEAHISSVAAGSSPATPALARPVPASINSPIKFSRTSRRGADCALMKKASIGKRSPRWRGTTAANTT